MFYSVYYKVYENNKFIIRIDFDDVYKTVNGAMSDILCYIAKLLYTFENESEPVLRINNDEIKVICKNKTYEFFVSKVIK